MLKRNMGLKGALGVFIIITFLYYLFINYETRGIVEEFSSETNDVYGEWKVTRLIGAYQATKGDLPYGTNVGRSFVITGEKITDSTDLQEALEEDEEQRCFSMDVTQREESVFKVVKPEDIGEFQRNEGIILDYVGFRKEAISKYTFSTCDDDDYHTMPEFSVYTYNDKDKLLVSLPMGHYLMERFKEQQKGLNPYGRWMVSYRISEGNSKENGIAFMDYYGQCFDIAQESFGRCDTGLSEVKWEVREFNKIDFEKQYDIQEGLGLNNEKIDVWFGESENDFPVLIVPVNDTEIIMLINEQWYMLEQVKEYREPEEEIYAILNDEWKFAQLVAAGEVDTDKEICGTSDYKAWWYTQRVTFDVRNYAKNAVTDWKTERCFALEFYNKYNVPDNVQYLFHDEDFLQVAIRQAYGIEEIYVVINQNTMIRGRNGLWYKLIKI